MKKLNIDKLIDNYFLIDIITHLEPTFTITESKKQLIGLLFAYFTGDENYPQLQFDYLKSLGHKDPPIGSLKKSLWITGNVGCGKSLLFKAFKIYTACKKQNSFKPFDYLSILEDFEGTSTTESKKQGIVTGMDALKQFGLNLVYSRGRMQELPSTIYIDDLGVRTFFAKSYSTEINLVDELIALRHKVFEKHQKHTHVSTNVYMKEFADSLDGRNLSRMFEMYNIIEFKDRDWRKTK